MGQLVIFFTLFVSSYLCILESGQEARGGLYVFLFLWIRRCQHLQVSWQQQQLNKGPEVKDFDITSSLSLPVVVCKRVMDAH